MSPKKAGTARLFCCRVVRLLLAGIAARVSVAKGGVDEQGDINDVNVSIATEVRTAQGWTERITGRDWSTAESDVDLQPDVDDIEGIIGVEVADVGAKTDIKSAPKSPPE